MRNKIVKSLFFMFIIAVYLYSSLLDSANLEYNRGKYTKAIELYKKARINGANPVICFFNIANAYYAMDSLALALVYYKNAVFHAPQFFRAHLNLATVYYVLEDYVSAIMEAKNALFIRDTSTSAMLVLAAAYKKLEAYSQAYVILEKLISIDNNNKNAYILLADINTELRDTLQAIEWLLKYPDNDNKNILYRLAEYYENMGLLEKSLYWYRKLYSIDSRQKWVLYKIVELEYSSDNKISALSTAQTGLKDFPDFGELLLLAGKIAFDMGMYDKAYIYFSKAKKLGLYGGIAGLENLNRITRIKQKKQ